MCICMCAHTCTRAHGYLHVYLLWSGECVSQRMHIGLVHRYCCLFPPLCSRLVAPFPGSSHLPTLLLFLAFWSWAKQRQFVGSTANPQRQAVFLQEKVEQKYSIGEQTRGSSSLEHLIRSSGEEEALKLGRQSPHKHWPEPPPS